MLNSGGNAATHNTAGWTNFTQPCQTASASDMKALICANGNTDELKFGQGIGAVNGVQDTVFDDLYDCWAAATSKTTNWNLTLPVILCPGNQVPNCATLVGAVNVDVLWMLKDPKLNGANAYAEVPTTMTIYDKDGNTIDSWSNSDLDGFTRWKDFIDHFHLANVDGPPTPDDDYQDYKDMYQKKNIFFLPSCEVHEPVGTTGGENFGIQAKIPVLVE
jgi:hypothetical protein